MAAPMATTVEHGTSVSFAISGLSTIPSDGRNGQQTHKVSIAVIELHPQIEWISVPKIKDSVFMRCRVRNTSQYILLPGPASVYMDGSFVCKSSLPNVSPQESFSTSLGVDPAIKVTYHNQQRNTKSNAGSILTGKNDITSYTQRITVKNTRPTNVSPLFIEDHIPTSENAEIKVTITEPKDIGEAKDRREVRVAPGVNARWAFHNSDDDDTSSTSPGGGVEEEGTIEWVCDIEKGKTIDVSLQWDVAAPAGRRWVVL